MSIADLKSRLADVPGIENLNMSLEAGRIFLRWGSGYTAAVDAAASDHDIEVAVRDAIKLPPLSAIPEKQAGVTVPSASPAQPSQGAPMSSTPSDAMNRLDAVLSDHVRQMEELQKVQLQILTASLTRQRETVAQGIGNVAARVDGQTDDFEAVMRRYSNTIG